jgi:hypothetical protein
MAGSRTRIRLDRMVTSTIGPYYKTLRNCNFQKMDRFRGKICSFIIDNQLHQLRKTHSVTTDYVHYEYVMILLYRPRPQETLTEGKTQYS